MASAAPPAALAAGLAPVTSLAGVGPALAAALARLGLQRVQDLWFHLPLRYEDRTRLTPVADLRAGTPALVEGVVQGASCSFAGRPQLRVALCDAAGARLGLRFFHFRHGQLAQFATGLRLRCFGEVRFGPQGPEFIHPQVQRIAAGGDPPLEERLTPIYPSGTGLGQRRLSALVAEALRQLPPGDELELIPAELRQPLRLMALREALLIAHHPPPDADLAALASGRHPAQRRLAFEELLSHHLSLRRMRLAVQNRRAPALRGDGRLRDALLEQLSFTLTAAQQRVNREILTDLRRARPMLRLVQGDVGSGKTVVAALAILAAVEADRQAAFAAPTELLAEQHHSLLRAWFEPLGIEPVWLAGKVVGRTRERALAAIAAGAPVTIGTHALMQEGVHFPRLGLAVIDEQHRFGVHQRLSLSDRRKHGPVVPHQLVLTATPIPRTLAMTAYADLDVSIIDQLPPGRRPVRTVAVSAARRAEVIERIRVACAGGRQAYWVCTLIEESEQLEAQAAESAFAELSAALPECRIGLVHGRLKARDKQVAMDAFKVGETRLLVATTVIEVGVDVPNASLMVIENAERLGLAQLHQLRGRVGRGRAESSCVLLYQPPLSRLARARLELLRDTADGFRIAEKDLELRGPGELLGTRQAGQLALRVADLVRDANLLPEVQRVGAILLRDHLERVDRLVDRWFGGAARYAGA